MSSVAVNEMARYIRDVRGDRSISLTLILGTWEEQAQLTIVTSCGCKVNWNISLLPLSQIRKLERLARHAKIGHRWVLSCTRYKVQCPTTLEVRYLQVQSKLDTTVGTTPVRSSAPKSDLNILYCTSNNRTYIQAIIYPAVHSPEYLGMYPSL